MKKKIVSALLTATMVCGMCVVPTVGVAAADDAITVGFSQVGAESDWRTAMWSTQRQLKGILVNILQCKLQNKSVYDRKQLLFCWKPEDL